MKASSALWCLAALAFAGAFQGARPLADPDEGRYAEAAREMLVSGDWLTPRLDGRPHWTKPPGTYWVVLASLRVFGVRTGAARFGVDLAFAGWILAASVLGRRLGGDGGAGIWSGVALATSAAPFVGGSLLTPDVFIAALDAAAAAAFVRALTDAASRRVALRVGWATLGLAFFFKGHPALLPLLGLLAAWPRRDDPRPEDRLADAGSLALFFGLGFSWCLWLAVRSPGVLAALVHRELVQAPFVGALGRNLPFWGPAAVLLAGALPWAPFALLGLRRGGRGILEAPAARFLLAWGLGGLVIFTLSRSRMPLYVLPLTTTLAVPAGVNVAKWVRAGRTRVGAASGLALVLAIGLLGLRARADLLHYRHSDVLAARVAALLAPGEHPVLLQSTFLPGLAFALQRDPRTVAMNAAERAAPHDLEIEDLDVLISREPAGVVAVGAPAAFAALPATWRTVDFVPDRTSGFGVARIVRETRESPGSPHARALYSPAGAPRAARAEFFARAGLEISGDEFRDEAGFDAGNGGRRSVDRRARAD